MTFKEFVNLPEHDKHQIVVKTFKKEYDKATRGLPSKEWSPILNSYISILRKIKASNDPKHVQKLFNELVELFDNLLNKRRG